MTRGQWNPPPAGTVYMLSWGRFAEAERNSMNARVTAAHWQAAAERLTALQSPPEAMLESVVALDTVRTGDAQAVLAASRQRMVSRCQPLHAAAWGAAATEGRQKGQVHQVMKRRRLGEATARELTGGHLGRIFQPLGGGCGGWSGGNPGGRHLAPSPPAPGVLDGRCGRAQLEPGVRRLPPPAGDCARSGDGSAARPSWIPHLRAMAGLPCQAGAATCTTGRWL